MIDNIIDAMRTVVTEKGISEDLVKYTIEEFLIAAYKKKYGTADNVTIEFSDDDVSMFARKKIVEELYNPVDEIELEEAQQYNSDAEIGDELLIKIDPQEFNRSAIQSAKQRAQQTLQDIQKDTLYSEFKSKEGEMIIGYYQRERNGTIFVDLGKTEGILPRRYQNPRETYRPNDRIKALIYEVEKGQTGLQIILTRTHTEFVQKIFELEVPEIYDKTVEVFKIVREPGYRTKIAVYSNRIDVDPVGACVGLKGVRIQSIVRELEGEKIDILKFATDPRELIQNALSPASVRQVVILDEIKKHALAIVEEDQLSLAIGKRGLNVRLANRLIDWNIDVKTEEQFDQMDISIAKKQALSELFSDDDFGITRISELPNINPRLVAILNRDNIEQIEDLISLDPEEMSQLNDITEEDVIYLQRLIKETLIVEEKSLPDEEVSPESTAADVFAEPTAEAAAEPAAEAEAAAEPAAEDSAEPEAEATAEPAAEPVAEVAAEPAAEKLPEAQEQDEAADAEDEITFVSELTDIPEHAIAALKTAGIDEIVDLLNMSDEELHKVPGLADKDILTIKDVIQNTIEVIEEDE